MSASGSFRLLRENWWEGKRERRVGEAVKINGVIRRSEAVRRNRRKSQPLR